MNGRTIRQIMRDEVHYVMKEHTTHFEKILKNTLERDKELLCALSNTNMGKQ